MRIAAAAALMLLAGPALAQTDDRISNDALQLLAADKVITEIGTMCIADTADPVMAEAIAGWRARNQNWRIIAVTTLGVRGVPYGDAAFALAEKGVRETMLPSYEAADDKAAWCLRMARDIETGQLTAGLLYPDSAQRIEESRDGKWPVLDVAGSHEVHVATEMLEWFDHNEQLMARCAAAFPERQKTYEDAYPYWRGRNIEYWIAANKVMRNWGALDPGRIEAFRRENKEDIDFTFDRVALGEPVCEDFVAKVESGAEDVAEVDPYTAEFLLGIADVVPE